MIEVANVASIVLAAFLLFVAGTGITSDISERVRTSRVPTRGRMDLRADPRRRTRRVLVTTSGASKSARQGWSDRSVDGKC